MIEILQQFIDGERGLEETDFGTEEYVATYKEYKDGRIHVSDEDGKTIIETTLEEWRASL